VETHGKPIIHVLVISTTGEPTKRRINSSPECKTKITHLGIKSLLDVGCGRGISTSWFVTHGLEFVQCVEGSHDAVMRSIVPDKEERVVEHDFSRGPWWPDRTVDAVWAVEFVRFRTSRVILFAIPWSKTPQTDKCPYIHIRLRLNTWGGIISRII
jgi:hypothetical protein